MEIVIPGDPIPQKRHRMGRGRTYDPSAPYKRKLAEHMICRARQEGWILKIHPYVVEMVFCCPYPKNKPKHLVPMGDLDNYSKAVLDAGNGILWPDDRYIVSLHITKHYSKEPRTQIKITA